MTTASGTNESTGFQPQWQDPSEEQFFFFRDIMHNPAPVSPLTATLVQPSFERGVNRSIAKLSMPILGLLCRVHHGYVYLGPIPFMGTAEEMDGRMAEMERLTMEMSPTVLQDWREQFEPQIEAMAARILGFDYAGASTQELAAHAVGFFELLTDAWDIHMRVNIPIMNLVFGFEEWLGIVAPDADLRDARKLLQGFENKSVEMGRAMWELSRWVRSQPALAAAIAQARVRDGHVVVEGNPPGFSEFEQMFAAFLDHWGWRSDVFMESGHPSWREDPSSALLQLKNFMSKPDSEDPFVAFVQQGAERDALVSDFEARIPDEARPQFRMMLKAAQQFIPISEDHNFTIDQRFFVVVRHGLLELGKRLAAEGVLARPDDVFYLEFDEVQALAAGNADASQFPSHVRQRRQRRIDQGRLHPPPFLGTPLPADAPVPPLVTKFFGFGVQQSDDPSVLNGNPCSSGSVTGIARVVMTLDEAHKLNPGEILVCPMTMPAWTPLFGIAAAIVADSGGPLSHCAVVAREYGIPCVAGTMVGTQVIRDGARISVDGTTGTVLLLDERPARG